MHERHSPLFLAPCRRTQKVLGRCKANERKQKPTGRVGSATLPFVHSWRRVEPGMMQCSLTRPIRLEALTHPLGRDDRICLVYKLNDIKHAHHSCTTWRSMRSLKR